jgi:hypothetical protein
MLLYKYAMSLAKTKVSLIMKKALKDRLEENGLID